MHCRRNTIVSILVTLTLSTGNAFAATFYVSPAGNDRNPGTLAEPWKSITKANSTLRAGDTLNFRGGSYSGVIQPANSGATGKPITYQSFKEETVRVYGPAGSTSVVLIQNKSHIIVDGLSLQHDHPPPGKSGNIDIVGEEADYNVIRNVSLVGTRDMVTQHQSGILEAGIRVMGGDHNTIENSTISRFTLQGLKIRDGARFNTIKNNKIVDTWGDPIRIDTSWGIIQGNLIEGNDLGRSVAANGIQFNGDYDNKLNDTSNRGVVIRRNRIFGNAEMCIALKGTSDIVVEENICYGHASDNNGFTDGEHQRNSSPAIHRGGSTFGSENVIIRRNIVYDNQSGINGYDNWKIYNNTVIGNNRDFEGPNSSHNPKGEPFFVGIRPSEGQNGISIKNNIVCDHNNAEVSLRANSRFVVDGNIYCNRGRSMALVMWAGWANWSAYGFREWQTFLRNVSQVAGNDEHSLATDPMFVNVPARPVGDSKIFDFSLSRNSPSIDAAAPLTRTVGSGSGTSIVVADARYFFDGYGIVQGDKIRIGNLPALTVLRVDYDANRLTVNRSVSWSNGMAVSLDYAGAAPDIGAIEFGMVAENDKPKAPMLF